MASLMSLPPGVLALIGGHLGDLADRNACVVAARALWGVHELSEDHALTFSNADDPRKALCAGSIMRHVLSLKPRLRILTVAYSNLTAGCEDPWPPAAAHFLPPRVSTVLQFRDCDDEFVGRVACAHARAHAFRVELFMRDDAPASAVADLMAILRAGSVAVERLACSHGVLADLPTAALTGVKEVMLTVGLGLNPLDHLDSPVVDLRRVPEATDVHLWGDVVHFQVLGVERITALTSTSPTTWSSMALSESFRRHTGACRVRRLTVLSVFPHCVLEHKNPWTQVLRALPSTAVLAVSPWYPEAMRMIEVFLAARGRLENVRLWVTCATTRLSARMVQLVSKRAYKLVMPENCDAGDAHAVEMASLPTVRAVFDRMDTDHQALWYFARY